LKDAFQCWLDHHNTGPFGRAVLRWFRKHGRKLPWRESPDPYRVWVSEIMLQQTRVETVIAYYQRFLKRFPDVQSLAAAGIDEVLQLWEGLGYYRRARSLHAAARIVVQEYAGQVPLVPEDLLKLPGIGRYTAGAILSIANDQRQPILEGNTIRLHSRLVACQQDIDDAKTRNRLWSFADAIIPGKHAGDFNQALMDLGSTICKQSGPDCPNCPVVNFCAAFRRGSQHSIPRRNGRVIYEDLYETALIVQRRKKILVIQRGPDEWWSGLWDFPRVRLNQLSEKSPGFPTPGDSQLVRENLLEQFGLRGKSQPTGIQLKHAVTRYRITLECLAISDVSGRIKSGMNCKWQTPGQICQLALTTSARRIVKSLEQSRMGCM